MLDFLYKDGFKASPFVYPNSFNNWIVYLRSNKFVIRIVQDRGEIFLSLASPHEKAKEISDLRYIALSAFIGYFINDISYALVQNADFDIYTQLEDFSEQLCNYYEELCVFFRKENFVRRMNDFDRFLKERRDRTIREFNKKS